MDHETLAWLSANVYRQTGEPEATWRRDLPQRLASRGLRLRTAVDRRDTQAIVVESVSDHRLVAIVFRGTEPRRGVDVDACLNLLPIGDLHGSVHRGFAAALNHVFFEVRCALSSDDQVHLTGHSMGGALAVIAASRMIRDHRVAKLVTFGAPPCVRPELARMLSVMLNGSCVRYEAADVVTMLLRFIYKSPGHLNYITHDARIIERAAWFVSAVDRVRVIGESIADRLAAVRRGEWRVAVTLPRMIRGHSMMDYWRATRPAGSLPTDSRAA